MQTFLPYPSFIRSAKCLDYRRLGKQRVEALQILNVLDGKSKKMGWRNHPAVLMWEGYYNALCIYKGAMIFEWVHRGYNNTMEYNYPPYIDTVEEWNDLQATVKMPPWLHDVNFHRSHRSNLVRKLPEFYRDIFPSVPDNLEYIWPKP